jgi:Lrp/AsnC family leucine-responsive transcriptional regulator
LEADGTITRYVALIDPDKVGLSVTAFVRVRLDQQDDRHLEDFETAVASFPEVMECYLMTGEADYQLRILVASLTQFEDFLRHRLTRVKGVANVTTSFALRPVIYKTSVPTL